MPKLNNIDFTSIVRFNGATFESGGGGATILTDWATRLNGTFSEGDTAVWSDTGAVYRWNASLRGGNGDWMRSEAYSSSFGDVAYFDGDEADASETLTKGWDLFNVPASDSVIFDGTHITFKADGAASQCYLMKNTNCNFNATGSMYAQGLYSLGSNTAGTYLGRLLVFDDQTESTRFQIYSATDYPARVQSSTPGAERGDIFLDKATDKLDTSSGEVHLAFHKTPHNASKPLGMVQGWYNHSLEPFVLDLYTLSDADANDRLYIASYNFASSVCELKIRAFTAGYAT